MSSDQSELLHALHDVQGPALFRYVLRITGDYTFAEDVVQESLLRAWKNRAILEQSDEATRAWLFTVARNLVIDDRRSARHNREISTDAPPDVPSPDKTESVLDTWLLSDALLTLSLQHRAVVVSAYYLGHTVAQIAQQQGIPEGTVKSRLHYALRALRLALQERGITQ